MQNAKCLWLALQVAVDNKRLGRAIRAAEQALQKEIPPPSLFDSLKDSVSSMLMPYWAAFQKHWLKRSVASAQRVPGRSVVMWKPKKKHKRIAIVLSPF